MSKYNEDGILMNKWHKSPNSIIDELAGDVLSCQACVILQVIIRYTWGCNKNSASIPHKVFMQKTRTKRAETLKKYIGELEDCGIAIVVKENGKTTKYSINKSSKYIANVPNLDEQTTTDEPLRSNSSGTDETGEPLRMNRTRTSTDEPYSNKDSFNKDSFNKENTKEKNKKENPKNYKPEKPDSVSDQIWLDLLSHRKSKKTSNTQTAWTMIFNQLEKAQQTTGHTLDQIITEWIARDWKGFKSDWYINAQANQNKAQGNNYANNQSTSTAGNGQTQEYDTSTTAGYAAKLDADAAAYWAAVEAEQGADGSSEGYV